MPTATPPRALEFRCDYYRDPTTREKLNAFVGEIFPGLNFSPWNDLGFEFPEYVPFSFFDRGRLVANVSASAMNLFTAGREVAAVQIGTVATRPAYRRQGLIRRLMEKAHAHWAGRRDFFFLFANETTADFYQPFGYRRVREHAYRAAAPAFRPPRTPARRLDLSRRADRELLHRLAERRVSVSARLGVHRQSWLLMFHAVCVYPSRLFYLEEFDLAAIAAVDGEVLRLIDLVGERIPTLEEIYPCLGAPAVKTIEFGFMPDRLRIDSLNVVPAPDSLVFVRGDFPLEGEPFLFPLTSQA